MKAYIVTEGTYSDYHICSVFSSKGIVCIDNIDIYRRNKQYVDARIREYAEGLV